jgi:hypothetical protein
MFRQGSARTARSSPHRAWPHVVQSNGAAPRLHWVQCHRLSRASTCSQRCCCCPPLGVSSETAAAGFSRGRRAGGRAEGRAGSRAVEEGGGCCSILRWSAQVEVGAEPSCGCCCDRLPWLLSVAAVAAREQQRSGRRRGRRVSAVAQLRIAPALLAPLMRCPQSPPSSTHAAGDDQSGSARERGRAGAGDVARREQWRRLQQLHCREPSPAQPSPVSHPLVSALTSSNRAASPRLHGRWAMGDDENFGARYSQSITTQM